MQNKRRKINVAPWGGRRDGALGPDFRRTAPEDLERIYLWPVIDRFLLAINKRVRAVRGKERSRIERPWSPGPEGAEATLNTDLQRRDGHSRQPSEARGAAAGQEGQNPL
ncbi:hypothetical protein GCM10023088_06450 [Actinomadura verrucosospora]